MSDYQSLLEKIIIKFKTQRACANAIVMNESAFSKLLKRPTPKFLVKLKSVGIVIDESPIIKEPQTKYKSNEVGKLKIENYDLQKRVEELEVKLNQTIESKDKTIAELSVAIALLNKKGVGGA